MTKGEYLSLNTSGCRFLAPDGYIIHRWDSSMFYSYAQVNELICKQLEESIDFHNIVIAFPGYSGGVHCFVKPKEMLNNSDRISIDYCTFPIDVKEILHSQGVKFKNNISLLDRKYSQMSMGCLVVQDGIAYVVDNTSNPYKIIPTYSRFKSFEEIKLNDNDVKKGVTSENKHMMFSGLFIERAKQILRG